MIGFTLTETQLAAQKTAREFADKQIKPFARDLDRMPSPHFDWKIVDRFASAGYTSFFLPKEYGGGGVDALTIAIICEEIAVACAGICAVLGATMLASNCLKAGGTEEQKKKYLSSLADNKGKLGAMAITEASAGSDLGGVSTLARREKNDFVISGTKSFISNAGIADLYIVLATTDPARKYAGLDFFIVPADTPGLSVGKIEDKLGLRAAPHRDYYPGQCTSPRRKSGWEAGNRFPGNHAGTRPEPADDVCRCYRHCQGSLRDGA